MPIEKMIGIHFFGVLNLEFTEKTVETYYQIRKRAREIVSGFPPPDFYKEHPLAISESKRLFNSDPTAKALRAFVEKRIDNDFGHGMRHTLKVSMDAGALMVIESGLAGFTHEVSERRVLIVQCAALLHDMKRKRKNHAVEGALYAGKVLGPFGFSRAEIDDITGAIRNHEAFRGVEAIVGQKSRLVSDCLYDADKFRWGPDNFMDTVWDMVIFSGVPLSKFIDIYPKGMDKLKEIKKTFRSLTGKKYGPRFIDMGLAIGDELYEVIKREFSHLR